jgi:hypothetical protein
MIGIVEEIQRAISNLGVDARKLDASELQTVRDALRERYARDPRIEFYCDNISDYAAFHAPDTWFWIEEFLPEKKLYLLTDPRSADAGFMFSSRLPLMKVLEECFLFIFYLTDDSFSFVLGQDDHDVLIGAGSAAPWVRGLRERVAVQK